MTPVSRVGDTVRRATGPWTPAVHALLGYLAGVGFDAAPSVEGVDEHGREVLGFVHGEDSHHARSAALHSDGALSDVGVLIRRYHEAVAGFVPPDDAEWQFLAGAPREGIVCHNDLAPVNTIFSAGRPVAFIDWEYAAPAPPVWDLACAASSFIPLADDDFCRRYSYPVTPRGPRLRLLCDSYGLDTQERLTFLDVVRAREVAQYETLRAKVTAGDPASMKLWSETRGRFLSEIKYLDAERGRWQRYLD
jgi:aminoglycoside phosphotransferase (APT) family kinase protein